MTQTSDKGETGAGFDASEEAEASLRSDIAVTYGRVIGKREVDTVDKAAVETSC